MTAATQAQLDFISLIYGVAFFGLASTCFLVRDARPSSPAWRALGLFGLIHGLNEWLDLAALNLGDAATFAATRVVVMAASFVFLFEFGRAGAAGGGPERPGRWILLPFLAAAALGAADGIPGLSAATRYALALPGGAWAALTLWTAARRSPSGRRALQASAAVMAGYALAAGVVVSPASFSPASWLNTQGFLQSLGFPVQLLRALLACAMTIAVWRAHEATRRDRVRAAGASPDDYFGWIIGAIALAAVIGGYALVNRTGRIADANGREQVRRTAQFSVGGFDQSLLAALTGTEADLSSAGYRFFKKELRQMRRAMPEIRFIYLMRKIGEQVVFLADSEPEDSPDYSPPGSVYREVSAELGALFDGGEAFVEGPLQDEWGTWVSGLAPIVDRTSGRVLAVLGLDLDAQRFAALVARARLGPIALTGGACLVLIFLFFYRQTTRDAALRLQASEERYRRNFTDHQAVMLLVDPATAAIVDANPAACAYYGYARDQLLSMKITDINTRPVEEVKAAMARAAARQARLLRFPHRLASGEIRQVEVRSSPADYAGRLLLHSIVIDVTDREKAEAALRESQATLSSIIEFLPDATFAVDREGRIIIWNRAIEEMTGRPAAEMLGKGDYEYALPFYGERRPILIDRARGVRAPVNPTYQVFQRAGNVISAESFAPGPSWGATWFWVTAAPLLDEAGNVIGAIESVRDISDRKRAEEQTRRSEERYRLLAENVQDVIWTVDEHNSLTYVSPSVTSLTGYTVDEFLSRRMAQLLTPESLEAVALDRMSWVFEPSEKTARGAWPRALEVQYVRKDGAPVWTEVQVSPLRNAAGVGIGWLGVTRDISRRKQAEGDKLRLEEQLAQAQKMEAVGRLAGGVAHDFNNILTAITGNAQMLLGAMDAGDPMRPDLEEIKRAADRAAALTAQLLAFSRKQVIQPRVVDLNELVQRSSSMLKRLIGEDIELALALDERPLCIRADESQLEQVLINLAVNARDAMPNGGRLAIETGRTTVDSRQSSRSAEAAPGDYARLLVVDNGAGMDAWTLEHLFEPFFTTKEKGRGAGLGLSMIYGIVKQHGGFIEVRSRPGIGTSFEVGFPLLEGQAVPDAPDVAASAPAAGGECILLVEDEEMVRSLTERVLRRQGYRVILASSGDEALARARGGPQEVDLLLTDVIMPGLNGKQLYERLRTLMPTLRVVFMSGYTADVIARHGVLDAETHFLQKPFTIEALAAKVREALDR